MNAHFKLPIDLRAPPSAHGASTVLPSTRALRSLPVLQEKAATPIEAPGSKVELRPRAHGAPPPRSVRVSVTDRCDFACTYCRPSHSDGYVDGRLEVGVWRTMFEGLRRAGVERVRLTGGEPLVHPEILEIVRELSAVGFEDVALTTNASQLARLAKPLAAAGLHRLNISIDTLDPARFKAVTRGGDLAKVLEGIRAALDVGLEVKINTVLLRGETDDEAERLVRWAFDLGVTPRFIELMPLGEGANLPTTMRVPASEVIERLGSLVVRETSGRPEDHGPARYVEASDGSGRRVGFITPLSDEFCGSCNRVRITARGDVRACLASRKAVSIRDLMRAGADDRELAWALHWSLSTKARGHFFLEPEVDEHTRVGMSLIGG